MPSPQHPAADRPPDAGDAITPALAGPVTLSLLATIPAFYEEMRVGSTAPWLGNVVYAVAGLVLLSALAVAARGRAAAGWWRQTRRHPLDPLLAGGLLAAAIVPASHAAGWALALRLAVAVATLLRLVLTLRGLFTPGGLPRLLALGGVLFAACGAGFWWLEPSTPTLADGLWLAFTTGALTEYFSNSFNSRRRFLALA